MIEFPPGTEFFIGFDKSGNVVVYGIFRLSPKGENGLSLFRTWNVISFAQLPDAKAFFDMGIKFCEENQTKVPDAFIQALGDNDDKDGSPAKL